MPSFILDDHSSTKDQDCLDDIINLIHILDDSMNQRVTPSFSSPPSSILLSPNHLNASEMNEERFPKYNHINSKRTADTYTGENIMSIHSPSSTASCHSPRTIHSNLSTPTTFSQAIVRFEDKIIDNEKSLYFLNPFITPSQGQTAYLSVQGSQSVPVTTNTTMQSYFDSSDRERSVTNQAMDIGNDSFYQQVNTNSSASMRQSTSNNDNQIKSSYIPHFGKPFTPKVNNQEYDERYWMTEQALASTQIQNFDLMIESLAAEGEAKIFSGKKRAPSKTFEDIMPYLSGNSPWVNADFDNVEAPKLYKRSRTDTTFWQSKTQHLSNSSVERQDPHAYLNMDLLNRQRQRSKTTSIVYAMKDTPIIPLKPTFSQLKEELHIPPKQASGLVGAENTFDHTNVKLTTCKFVEQAARTALKGVKSQNDFEVSKRATAGLKARDEQNREKSKRYYDRKKAQSAAMSGLCTAIEAWQSTYSINLLDGLQTDLDAQQAEGVAMRDYQIPTERQKALKEIQKMKEAFQIKTLMACAERLEDLLKIQPHESAADIVLSHNAIVQSQISEPIRSKEYMLLESGLHIWLDYLHCWADLVLAEKRLAQKTGIRPIYQIISCLTELL